MRERVRTDRVVEAKVRSPATWERLLPHEATTDVHDEFSLLLKGAQRLDRQAWDRLYEIAFPQVYRYVASKIGGGPDAEDVTEEVFLGALQGINGLRAADQAGFLGWLFQIARHKLADRLRRRYRRPSESLDPEIEIEDEDLTPEERVLRQDLQSTVRAALAELTPEQQEVIVMKFALGYDNARVAVVLGKSPGAINQLQHRALGALRRVLDRGGE